MSDPAELEAGNFFFFRYAGFSEIVFDRTKNTRNVDLFQANNVYIQRMSKKKLEKGRCLSSGHTLGSVNAKLIKNRSSCFLSATTDKKDEDWNFFSEAKTLCKAIAAAERGREKTLCSP